MKKVVSILLALIVLTLPILSMAESADKVTLYYYGWTDEQSYMQLLIDKFMAENPDIEIVSSFINHSDHNDKTVVMVSGKADNLDLISCDSQATVMNLVTLDGLMPLKSYIEAAGMDMGAYGPIINETIVNDDFYGVPYRSTLYSLYYNKDLFDKKGIAYPEKITWEEYLDLARQLTYEEDGTQYWGAFLADWLGCPLSIYAKNSNLLDDDISAIVDWVEIWNTGVNVDKSHMSLEQQTAESIDWLKFFCLGTTGMLINGEWTISMLKDYENQGIEIPNWDVTYLPGYDKEADPVSPGGLSTFITMGKNTKHPEECFRFIQFMGSEAAAVELAAQGVLPAYSSEAVMSSFATAAGVPGAGTLLATTISLEVPPVEGYSEVQSAYQEEMKLYLTKQQTLDDFKTHFIERREEVLSYYQ